MFLMCSKRLKFYLLIIFSEILLNVICARTATTLGRNGTKIVRTRVNKKQYPPCDTPNLQRGYVKLRQRGKFVDYTCFNGYHLFGTKYAGCVRGQWDHNVPMCITDGCKQLTVENGYTLSTEENGILTLICNSGYEIVGSKNTFCIGTDWDRSLGTCRETNIMSMTWCDFDAISICGWTNDPIHNFDWKHKNGAPSGRFRIGPKFDHTTKKPLEGYFMLLDNIGRYNNNDTARLLSPLYNPINSDNKCFSFYYHLYGIANGIIRIYLKPIIYTINDIKRDRKFLLFEVNNTHKNNWMKGEVNLFKVEDKFQIVIEGSLSGSNYGDIAIDDVELNDNCNSFDSSSTTEFDDADDSLDIGTCFNRCDELPLTTVDGQQMSSTTSSSLSKFQINNNDSKLILQCDCYNGCIDDDNTCCPDYEQYCVFDSSDSSDFITTTTIFTTNTIIISKSSSNLDNNNDYFTKQQKPSTTNYEKILTAQILNNDYDEIFVTTEFNSNQNINQTYINDLKGDLLQDKNNDDIVEKYENVKQFKFLYILVPGIILIISIIFIIVYIKHYRQRVTNYKKDYQQTTKNVNEEFSEIRYLTSDEQLDFNLASPDTI